jgi:hypothetical protein
MPTKTGYSITGGGGKGYINVGGWNTTLTAKSVTQDQVPGTTRREGANVYIYGKQGTLSIEGKFSFVIFSDPAVDGGGTLISPVVFTGGPVGTDNARLIAGQTIQSMSAGVYGWYFKQGITTVVMGQDSGGTTVGSPIAPAAGSAGLFATALASGIGWALTAMASADSGPAFVSFGGKLGQSVF